MYRTVIVDISRGMTTIVDWPGLGFEICGTAENGRQALELCGHVSPQLVITDIKMPLMDGLELTGLLKQASPDLQVMLISGYSDFTYAKQAIKYGVSSYILKPIEVDELKNELQLIKKTLDNLHLSTNSLHQVDLSGQSKPVIKDILAYMDIHSADDLSLNKLGDTFFLNPFYIGKLIKKHCGVTFNEYLNFLRIENAKYLLRNTNIPIHEVCERIGYKFQDHFYRNFKKYVSVNPKEYRDCQAVHGSAPQSLKQKPD